ncbi:MAG: two pore domain potassium channel family protein [Desulfuromonadales bacterium]|nr:MAG: two pore domain potassium channel family protein [Desulfuromonadales bacterium]
MRPINDAFRRFSSFWLGDQGLSAFLLLLFVSLFLGPFIESLPLRIVSSLFFSFLMISGVVTISSRPLSRFIAGIVALAAIILRWTDRFTESHIVAIWSAVTSLMFLALMTGVMLIRVFKSEGQITRHRVQGAIAVYLLFGITWSIVYQLFDLSLPGAFTLPAAHHLDATARQETFTYFSFVTLTTLGYGDVTAIHPTARMFVIMEALMGQLYPATLLARLVSLEISNRQ